MTPELKIYFEKHGPSVEKALIAFLPKKTEKPHVIHEAMHYSVSAGGKRLRPVLVIAGAEICGGKASQVMPTACALEYIHTYSLIHDDLPAMDNDDLRRGKPTSHKVFGDDIAILAGDALLTYAFELIAKNADVKGISPKSVIAVSRLVADGAGTRGMVGGQVADIKADKGRWKKLKGSGFRSSEELLKFIHLKKTAALIRASLLAGGTLVGGNPQQLKALDIYGQYLGLAFQVTDDILDRIGDKKKLGKKGSDADNNKLTYPAIFGLPSSQVQAQKIIFQAHAALKPLREKAKILHLLADFVLFRDH